MTVMTCRRGVAASFHINLVYALPITHTVYALVTIGIAPLTPSNGSVDIILSQKSVPIQVYYKIIHIFETTFYKQLIAIKALDKLI